MQYSPLNAIPYLCRVDAGTVELIRSFGVEVVTSGDLVQRFEAVWSPEQLRSHQAAAEGLRRIVDDAFAHVAQAVGLGDRLNEHLLQQFILSRIHAAGMTTSSAPIVAVDAHSADPHYSPPAEASAAITHHSFVLIDLWAKLKETGSVYADITWTGYVGRTVPERYRRVFDVVRAGRDAAVAFVRRRIAEGTYPFGWEIDDACRTVIRDAGYADAFLHRTGHSIGEEVHGNGANIDNLETQDSRRVLPQTCFSIEPGIYLAGEFGIRSELDLYVSDRDAMIFGQPIQTEIVPIV
jgi:Xaa-Pro aminopeptidase